MTTNNNRDVKFRMWVIDEKKMYYGMWATENAHFTNGFRYRRSEINVMQYIGLKDINDEEIYEEDIVKIRDNKLKVTFYGIVDFQDASFVIKRNWCTHYRWMDYQIEILGNVYENPDLLIEYDIERL